MSHRTFPKEGLKKEKETIRELKSKLRQCLKEIQFLKNEIQNIMKPTRDRKPHLDKTDFSYEKWRKEFVRRWKKEVLGKEE